MADTHTPSLRLRLLEVGANEDTWGDELNANVISMIEEAVAGIVSVSVTAGNVTLSAANGTTDQSRNALIVLTGTPGTTRTVTFPDVEKLTWVYNNSDSSITCTAGAGTTISIPSGSSALVYTDGATNAAAMPLAYLANGKLGLGMTPSNILDISQNQNGVSSANLLNNNSGNAALGRWALSNGSATTDLRLMGTGFPTAGVYRENGAMVVATGAGGLTLNTSTNQPVYVGVNNAQIAQFSSGAMPLLVQVDQDDQTVGRMRNDSTGTSARAGWQSSNGLSTASLFMQGPNNTDNGNGAILSTSGPAGWSYTTSQIGAPHKFLIAGAEIARFDSSKLDLIVGQIKFPASQSASADANTLDDYEEGTFTPTITFGGNSVGTAYTTQVGAYTKIGNRVFFDLNIVLSNKGSSTGLAAVGGLPFSSSAAAPSSFPSLILDQIDLNVAGGFHSPGGDTDGATIILYEQGDNINSANLTNADFGNTSRVNISGTYRV